MTGAKLHKSSTNLQDSKKLYFRLLAYVKPYWKAFGFAVLAMILFSLTQASIPAFMKPLLDGTFVEKKETYLFWAPIVTIVLFMVRGTASFVSQVVFQWVATHVVFDLQQLIFQRYMKLPSRYYDNQNSGVLISKVIYDAGQVTSSATTTLIILIRDSVTALGLIGYVFYLNWKLSLTLLLLLPIVYVLLTYLAKRLRMLNRKLQHQYGGLTQILEESVKGNRVVKVYGGQEYELARFHEASNWLRRLQMKVKVASFVSFPIIETASAMIIAFIIYISTSGDSDITVGSFVSFFTAFLLLLPPIKNLTKINSSMQRGLAAAESVFALLDEDAEVDTGTKTVENISGQIKFNKVSFTYPGTEQTILEDFNLDIPAGTTVALVGPSGSGKTTIANLVPRFYSLTSGGITVDDTDITDITLKSLRQQISYVSQDVVLFNDTIAANIAYGQGKDIDEKKLEEAAIAAHALEFIEQNPEGFNTLIGENGIRLSGGQRQRLAIARALYKDTPILVLDEATSALDNESERHVKAALETVKQDRTTIIIAHRLSTIENADRIVFLNKGRITESGTHQELLALNGEYASFYQRELNDEHSDADQ